MQITSAMNSGAMGFGRATEAIRHVANEISHMVPGYQGEDPTPPQTYHQFGKYELDDGIVDMQNAAAVAKVNLAVMRGGKEQFNDLISILSQHQGK